MWEVCCSTTTSLWLPWFIWPTFSPPPPSLPSPVPGLPERGGGDHQAGSSRLHGITAAYIHMLSGRALHAKLELQRQHSLFISSRNTKQNITKILKNHLLCFKIGGSHFKLDLTIMITDPALNEGQQTALTACHTWHRSPPSCLVLSYRIQKAI